MGEKRYAMENLDGEGDCVGTLDEILEYMRHQDMSLGDHIKFYELSKPMKIALLEDK